MRMCGHRKVLLAPFRALLLGNETDPCVSMRIHVRCEEEARVSLSGLTRQYHTSLNLDANPVVRSTDLGAARMQIQLPSWIEIRKIDS